LDWHSASGRATLGKGRAISTEKRLCLMGGGERLSGLLAIQ
jgi:hypothetical protein